MYTGREKRNRAGVFEFFLEMAVDVVEGYGLEVVRPQFQEIRYTKQKVCLKIRKAQRETFRSQLKYAVTLPQVSAPAESPARTNM